MSRGTACTTGLCTYCKSPPSLIPQQPQFNFYFSEIILYLWCLPSIEFFSCDCIFLHIMSSRFNHDIVYHRIYLTQQIILLHVYAHSTIWNFPYCLSGEIFVIWIVLWYKSIKPCASLHECPYIRNSFIDPPHHFFLPII